MKNLKSISILTVLLICFTSCNDDDNVTTPVNEEEVITTVSVELTSGSQTITLTSRDLDGDGPNVPEVTVSGDLVAGTTYLGKTTFSNELASPAEDVTEEVKEEGKDHQIFYQLASNIGTVTYDDVDADGKPIGIDFTLVAGTASTGNLTVTLRHKPNKSASGVADGDITNAAGSTDASVTFPVTVN